jgi:hypothetical protein
MAARLGLLERADEPQRIVAAIAQARSGNGGVLAFEGSAGIGKTRLLRAAMELAASSEMTVLSAKGGQLEGDFAFGIVRQLFGQLDDQSLLEDSAWLAGAPPSGDDHGFATLHGLYRLTANLASRAPLLMVVDDAHWADAPSLRFLAFLAPRLHTLPVLLITATDPTDAAQVAELDRRALLLRQDGAPDEQVAAQLLAATPTGDRDVVEILMAAARAATHKGAPDIAVRYLRRAYAEPAPETHRARLLYELGVAEQRVGQTVPAAEHPRAALRHTNDLGTKIEIGFRLRSSHPSAAPQR